MPLLDKLSKAAKNAAAGASTLAKNAADSTGEAIAVQKLKMKINDEEKAIVEIKKFLGELTWQQFDGQGDKSAEIEEQCSLIRDSLKNIAEIEQQIADLRAEKEAVRSERKAATAAAMAAAGAAAEDAVDAAKDAAKDLGDAAEKVVDKVGDAVEDAKETLREKVAEIKDDAPKAEAEVVEEAAEVVEEAAEAAEEAAEDVRCPQCGAQVSAGARFCGVCGAKMD